MNTLEQLQAIFEWMQEQQRPPAQSSSDPIERAYGLKLAQLRHAKNTGRVTFDPAYQDLANRYGFSTIFESRQSRTLRMLREIFIWMQRNGNRIPSKSSEDPQERYYHDKIIKLRQAKKNNLMSFYPSYQALAEQYGYPGIYESQDDEKMTLDLLNKIFLWMQHENRTPKTTSNDPIERSYGNKINNLRQAKKGTGRHRFYPSYLALAESYGYSNIFEPK